MRQREIELRMPWLSTDEPVTEVVEWLVKPGDEVEIEQDVLKLSVEGEEFILPSPLDGVIKELLVEPGETLAFSQVLAMIEVK